MNKDPFKEYLTQGEPDKREKSYAWSTAIGLQDVDKLKPSEYLINTALRNIEGDISFYEARELIDSYYETISENPDDGTEEADKVSVRIAALLSEDTFSFSSQQYLSIHKRLFDGIYTRAGKMRKVNLSKKEWVLVGRSVIYGSAEELDILLEHDFSKEQRFSYKGLSPDEIIKHISVFISRLWQIHVFSEGNTRTTAVFLIKYLRYLGFEATNDIFTENSWYFRNALVRANYNNVRKGVFETTEYLEKFLRNLLLGESNRLSNREMHIEWNEKYRDIDLKKDRKNEIKIESDITVIYADKIAGFSNKTVSHIQILFDKYGFDMVFGKEEIMQIVDIKSSASSDLLKKMLSAGIIIKAKGQGRGKYIFISD